MNEYELIDLQRIIDVLEGYGAGKEDAESPGRKAIDQLKRLCAFQIGQKVFVRDRFNNEQELYPGVVVAYCQQMPMFIVGEGDDRNKLPKDSKMLAFQQEHIYDRGEPPKGFGLATWKTLLAKINKRKEVKK